jgi:integrase
MLLSVAFDKVMGDKWAGQRCLRSVKANINGILGILGDPQVETITQETLSKLVRSLRAQGRSVATINRYLSTLQTTLKVLRVKADVDFTVFRKKERNGRIRIISFQEEDRLISLLSESDPDIAELVVVLVDTGLRLSEALNLDCRAISLPEALITVWQPKNDKPRSVPMTTRVREIFTRRCSQGNPPFPLDDNHVKYVWRKARQTMGLENDKEFVIHALRHTCASRLVQKGVDLYVVKEWLGHSSIQVTERYAHLAPTQLRAAVSVLERSEQVPPSWHV